MHRLVRRGFVAASALAMVATPTALLVNQAGAQPTHGPQSFSGTVYEVGTPPSNPTSSIGGGPFKAGGVVVGKGNIADLPNGDELLAFSNGTGTIEVNSTGGRFVPVSLNPVTCKAVANLINAKSSIVSGTGIYSAATGKFTLNLLITGVLPRNSTGGCNTSETASLVEDTVQFTANGNINLHPAS